MSGKKRVRRGFLAILIIILVFAIVAKLNFYTVVVSGPSMEPTFHTGNRLLVSHAWWLVGPVRDKEIVVVSDNNPDGFIIKRVYKMAGETVDWANVPRSWALTKGPYVVPPNQIFLLGDNRPRSEDSRSFGPVDSSRILGKVLLFK